MLKPNRFGNLAMNLNPINLARGTRQVHYAWVVVAIATTILLVTSSIRFATAALVPYLNSSASGFGWSYAAISFAFSLQWLVLAVMSPYVGWLGDRYGVRRLLLLGALLFIAGMVLTGIMTNLWQFYIYFGLLLGIASAIFTILLVSGVTLWFRRYLGVAMGVVWSFQGMGVVAFIFLIGAFFDQLGMKWIFWIPGIAGGALILLLTRFFYNEPAEIGLRPLGAPEDEPIERTQKDETAKIRASVFLRQAQTTGTFWNLIGIHYLGCIGHSIVMVGVVFFATRPEQGVSLQAASFIISIYTLTSSGSRFAVPVLADMFGAKWVMAFAYTIQGISVALLFWTHDPWQFYVFATVFGVGLGGEMSAFLVINRQYYGMGPVRTIFGFQNLGSGVGMAVGGLLGGVIFDLFGSYDIAWIISIATSLGGAAFILLLEPTSRLLMPDWEDALPVEARTPAPVASG